MLSDADGLRLTKVVDGVTHNYLWQGDRLVSEQYGTTELEFFYDEPGVPCALDYNGTIYYYITNLQGDVIGIVDASGTIKARYKYNAWGEDIDTTAAVSNIETINPLRYRGYYYDSETGLYYLQSRYYDPVVCRFINADDFAATGQGFVGYNMYAYCGNNPVSRKYLHGSAFETVFDIITLGFSIAEVAVNPYDPMAWVGLVGDVIDIIPFVTGVGETVRAIRFADKAGNVLELADAADFTDDAVDVVKTLDRSSNFTHSSSSAGLSVHKGYKVGDEFYDYYKEYRGVSGIRPDYYDEAAGVIYELKPFNPSAAKRGIKQLQHYNDLLGGNSVMRLEFY